MPSYFDSNLLEKLFSENCFLPPDVEQLREVRCSVPIVTRQTKQTICSCGLCSQPYIISFMLFLAHIAVTASASGTLYDRVRIFYFSGI